MSLLLLRVLQFMDEAKLIRDCDIAGSATTRGLSCVFSAMIITGYHLSVKGDGGENG